MTASLAIERQGPIGLVTMNRPERHNAFDDALIAELTEALRSMEAEEGIRLVVLSGAGKSFSAGADLHWMKRMAGYSKDENVRDAMAMGALMRTLAHLRKPTIARVQGAAYGGGVGLVACCDIAVASQSAVFALSPASTNSSTTRAPRLLAFRVQASRCASMEYPSSVPERFVCCSVDTRR